MEVCTRVPTLISHSLKLMFTFFPITTVSCTKTASIVTLEDFSTKKNKTQKYPSFLKSRQALIGVIKLKLHCLSVPHAFLVEGRLILKCVVPVCSLFFQEQ